MILSYESPTPTTSRDGRHCRAEREIGKLSIESVQTNLEWLISIRSIWWRWRDRYHAQITTGFRIDGRVLSKRSGTNVASLLSFIPYLGYLGSYPRWSESPVMCHHMLPNLSGKRADHFWYFHQAKRKQTKTSVLAWPICTFLKQVR